jgi:Tol biopolymer transport system component
MPRPASSPAWSPDGERVAFVAGAGSGEKGQVFVVSSDGTGLRQVTTVGSLYVAPTWSPDGERLVFETFDHELHIVNADGTDERRLGDYDSSSQPAWCPDGTLYFTAQRANETAHIHSMTPGGELGIVTQGSSPNCGPDGRIAFSRGGDVHVVVPGATGEPNLTASEDRSDFAALWSPDGSKMAFTSLRDTPDPTPLARTLSARLRGHLTVRGRLDPAPSSHGCFDFVKVQRMGERGWRKVDFVSVAADGRFRADLPDRPGFYRAVSDRHIGTFGGWDCLRAVSEIVRHRH